MVLWISRDEWSFLTFGSYMCGGMINAHKNDKHLFVCEAPMIGRYVTLQTNVHSDPDIVPYEYLNLQINELIVYGKATKCGRLLGLMTDEVTLAQITTSSFIDGFHSNQSRLNENGPGWCPKVEDKKPFIKMGVSGLEGNCLGGNEAPAYNQ
ncbi:uncharacterized protein LOC123535791 [Mercenaria mercenaria]|uniref:uncharacterized protein LOC123535791 n=1 Tax=Mercenaria mercenaria TaxID=6596 RepID=UPI00234E9C24|nr:uncharacterized protein LOC123535791 [Mercenaria mercenaria]